MSAIDYKNGGRPALPSNVQPASEKQVQFVKKLLAEKNLAMIAELALAIQDSLESGLTKQAASAAIDALLPLPRTALAHDDGNAVGEGYYLLDGTAYKVVKAKGSGNLYAKKFVAAPAPCPGHLDHSTPSAFDAPFLYCAEPCGAVKAGYEYAPGAMRLLTGAARLTLEQAAEMGRATGTCVVCGRLLTAEESVLAGIGPVCAARL